MASLKFTSLAFLVCWFSFLSVIVCTFGVDVSYDGRAIKIDGKRKVLLSGSIHYPRSAAEMWPDLIRKSKEGGLDAIETYVFWNAHEPVRRQYDFSGNNDLVRFIKTIQDEGLYAVLRIGPYNEMKNFTALIVNMMKQENLFASQGGPIILAQIENEYGHFVASYGDAGKAYVTWCANMAESLDIGVPWIMCEEEDAPESMINTCNGWYCDQWSPKNPKIPKMWTENWTGWFKNWGGKDPHRTAEDLAFAVARFFQRGGTFQNYYMYHGGTNFGRTAGGPYITTTYDYDAPLDEYGNLNQPKWGHLKQLHDILHSMEETLTHGNISSIDYGNSVWATIYKTKNASSCFFGNANSTSDATINFQGNDYDVPAWSVNTQTSVMAKRSNFVEDESTLLKWSWRPENNDKAIVLGKGQVTANQLLDQKTAANDASDYLWYMTSVNLKEDDPVWASNMTLRVNGTGHKSVNLTKGKNVITLLSATVGYQNYGVKFDMVQSGISGPVELVGRNGDETIIKDLSSHKWSYKVGLDGLPNDMYSSENLNWQGNDLPINRMMTWYKTTFKAPLGKDPVVVDLQGLGKGMAWVNGKSIGRYWPSYLAEEDGCKVEACDYRGSYDNNKCLGGNPSQVKFETVSVGYACANTYENNVLELSCQNRPISAIKFASFGNPKGRCGSFEKGTCEGANDALSIVQKACVGKETCTIDVSEKVFGLTNCGKITKRLAVEISTPSSITTAFPFTISTLFLAFSLLSILSLSFFFLSSSSSTIKNPSFPDPQNALQAPPHSPLKVYVADLPRSLNYGLLEQYWSSSTPDARIPSDPDHPIPLVARRPAASEFPDYPQNPLIKQYSAEYWITGDLMTPEPLKTSSFAQRVSDSGDADVVFVPFFATLSAEMELAKGGGSFRRKVGNDDYRRQREVVDFVTNSDAWRRSGGKDHVFVLTDPVAMWHVRAEIAPAILLVVDFGGWYRLDSKTSRGNSSDKIEHTQVSLLKDVIVPYTHLLPRLHLSENKKRQSLLYFKGAKHRHRGGMIREKLWDLLVNEPGVIMEEGFPNATGREQSIRGMRTSEFCLHPAGDTPTSCRLFDAVQSLCIPVVVSDNIELPFEGMVDYTEFSVFVAVNDALKPGWLVDHLRRISGKQRDEFRQKMAKVQQIFVYDSGHPGGIGPIPPDGAVNYIWRKIHQKVPMIREAIVREKRKPPGVSIPLRCQCT
ncbi:Beta-galactosidase 15 [Turnera subulata]|uniref:Beta-galactosidase n=1 Tax=Turnera subulata TaxID=218843 RepID=A0A9Q0JKL0_9ROSI|nr:Beta-galactosidase 15 [Turnera subulata]